MEDTIRDLAQALERELSACTVPLDQPTIDALVSLGPVIEVRTAPKASAYVCTYHRVADLYEVHSRAEGMPKRDAAIIGFVRRSPRGAGWAYAVEEGRQYGPWTWVPHSTRKQVTDHLISAYRTDDARSPEIRRQAHDAVR